ncbi:DUF2752 domain-containing protein [Streptomyces sp. NBC_00083]|uniref:DUF2752 domain-containing protein n=1 Tax=Streptomyces sp. NBC_00083 TaxID=2975647 RepID=UPI0022564131|nr:DUF2752 domain-containing protein [Streptomyces sp. NBC_00083]MCX5384479.1 DUF2752 domain-containing protein [Streptomyces sp. NBC_00083]
MPPAAAPLALACAAAAGLFYLYGHSPYDPGQLLPRCPFHWATGLNCPACGGTRMSYALLHRDLGGALRANPVLCAALPFGLWVYARWAVAALRGRRRRFALGPRGTALVLGTAFVWTVVRNALGR